VHQLLYLITQSSEKYYTNLEKVLYAEVVSVLFLLKSMAVIVKWQFMAAY